MTEETMARPVCEPREREEEEVLPGVTLAWDGAFRGSYGLAVAGGGKANLHMAAGGRGEESGRRFRLGFNLMLRGGRTA